MTSPGSDGFLNPPRVPTNMDLFAHRAAILEAICRVRGDFHGILLDVGCGQMPYKPLLLGGNGTVSRYIGLDLKDNPIHDNAPDIVWSQDRIPLEDEAVNCALCTEVLEHCPDPVSLLREVLRVLSPGGRLLITVPFLWPLHEIPYDYYRYTPFGLENILRSAGFTGIRVESLGGWDASLAQMLGLWVRRRPMGRRKRRLLSWVLWPIYKQLLKSDRRQSEWNEKRMLTGLVANAQKPANVHAAAIG